MNERTMFSMSCTILSGCPSIIKTYKCKLELQTTALGIKDTLSQNEEWLTNSYLSKPREINKSKVNNCN